MRDEHETGGRLPREWLPDASAPEYAVEWDVLARGIVAAAAPALEGIAGDAGNGWHLVLGSWLRPAVALAAAAALIAFAADRARPAGPGRQSLPLTVLAAGGDPAVLWESVGVRADPVLGLIALQGGWR